MHLLKWLATAMPEKYTFQNNKPRIVAIIRRNAEGEFEQCYEAQVDCGDWIKLVPALNGMVAVIGPIYESDRSRLEILLRDL